MYELFWECLRKSKKNCTFVSEMKKLVLLIWLLAIGYGQLAMGNGLLAMGNGQLANDDPYALRQEQEPFAGVPVLGSLFSGILAYPL